MALAAGRHTHVALHYPLDVLAGAALGTAAALGTLAAAATLL